MEEGQESTRAPASHNAPSRMATSRKTERVEPYDSGSSPYQPQIADDRGASAAGSTIGGDPVFFTNSEEGTASITSVPVEQDASSEAVARTKDIDPGKASETTEKDTHKGFVFADNQPTSTDTDTDTDTTSSGDGKVIWGSTAWDGGTWGP